MDRVKRLLVIEDDPADFLLLERQLRQQGLAAQMHRVASDAELDAALAEGGWDLLLSDYSVPGMAFHASLQRIRAQAPELPVILVSGSIGEEAAIELLHLGIADFILKHDLVRLGPAIRRSLDEREQRRARSEAEAELQAARQAAFEEQRRARIAALNLMEDARAAQREAESTADKLRQLSMAVEQSPESIVITDLDARIEYVNEAFLQTTGFAREEVIGQNPRLLHSGRTPDENYTSLWGTLKRGETWKGEFYNRRKDGSEYVEFAIITPIRQPDGRITHYVAVKEDVTEKKRLGAELDAHRHHLEQLVTERTAELEQARAQAEAATPRERERAPHQGWRGARLLGPGLQEAAGGACEGGVAGDAGARAADDQAAVVLDPGVGAQHTVLAAAHAPAEAPGQAAAAQQGQRGQGQGEAVGAGDEAAGPDHGPGGPLGVVGVGLGRGHGLGQGGQQRREPARREGQEADAGDQHHGEGRHEQAALVGWHAD